MTWKIKKHKCLNKNKKEAKNYIERIKALKATTIKMSAFRFNTVYREKNSNENRNRGKRKWNEFERYFKLIFIYPSKNGIVIHIYSLASSHTLISIIFIFSKLKTIFKRLVAIPLINNRCQLLAVRMHAYSIFNSIHFQWEQQQ